MGPAAQRKRGGALLQAVHPLGRQAGALIPALAVLGRPVFKKVLQVVLADQVQHTLILHLVRKEEGAEVAANALPRPDVAGPKLACSTRAVEGAISSKLASLRSSVCDGSASAQQAQRLAATCQFSGTHRYHLISVMHSLHPPTQNR